MTVDGGIDGQHEPNGSIPSPTPITRRSRIPLMHSRLLLAVAIQAFVIAIVLAYFEPHTVIINALSDQLHDFTGLEIFASEEKLAAMAKEAELAAKKKHHKKRVRKSGDGEESAGDASPPEEEDEFLHVDLKLKMITPDELAKHTTIESGIYLALLGKVYDVTSGAKHYGPGGGYGFFSGRDASRAFVTGDFTPAGLVDDVTGLTHQDYLGILEWHSFYVKDYKHIGNSRLATMFYQIKGYLIGTYYTPNGSPTPKLHKVVEAINAAREWKQQQTDINERFPPCNSEWSQKAGGRVWCTNKSGGINRAWVGVPRRLFTPGTKEWRCACIKSTGRPLDTTLEDTNTGDLAHPHLKTYAHCPHDAGLLRLVVNNNYLSVIDSCKTDDDAKQ